MSAQADMRSNAFIRRCLLRRQFRTRAGLRASQAQCRRLQSFIADLRGRLSRTRQSLRLCRAHCRRLQSSNAHLQANANCCDLRVTSPCTTLEHWGVLQAPTAGIHHSWYRWSPSWCPCCRRPLDITLFETLAPSSFKGGEIVGSGDASCIKDLCDVSSPDPGDTGEAVMVPGNTAGAVGQGPGTSSTLPRFAYVVVLWGSAAGFALGALVLGCALRRSGTRYDLVLLYTKDVPFTIIDLLSKVWITHEVPYLEAHPDLFRSRGRFDGVFTKLHVLSLAQYDKVLMLDIDLAILKCPDDLFDLCPPAAMCRGQVSASMPHGSPIDGRRFFAGSQGSSWQEDFYEWSQVGGINAGVVLLAPNEWMHRLAVDEVSAARHPERIPGSGPEQDYLSRLYAPRWTHIGISYNYQLHHVLYSLEAMLETVTDARAHSSSGDHHTQFEDASQTDTDNSEAFRDHCADGTVNVHTGSAGATSSTTDSWVPRRLSIDLSDIKIVHFSGEMKLWDRQYLKAEGGAEYDELFAERLLCTNQPWNTKLWFLRHGEPEEYENFGVRLTATGWEPSRSGVSSATEVTKLIRGACDQVRQAAVAAVRQWRSDLEALPSLGPGLPPLELLLDKLENPWGHTSGSAHDGWTGNGWSGSWHQEGWIDYEPHGGLPVHCDTADDY